MTRPPGPAQGRLLSRQTGHWHQSGYQQRGAVKQLIARNGHGQAASCCQQLSCVGVQEKLSGINQARSCSTVCRGHVMTSGRISSLVVWDSGS
eukprot:366331-Chlamydomonas_euryale.AAC.26